MQNNIPLISVIVPYKNAEVFLPALFTSLQNQSFSDFEVLIIDDHSTDASPALCHAQQLKDPRFRCFSSSGNGPSAARNTGLKNAKGQYIFFSDADDTLPKDSFKLLYSKAELFKADIIIGDFSIITSSGDRRKDIWFSPQDKLFNRSAVDDLVANYLHKPCGTAEFVNVWGKLYSTSLLNKHKIVFDETLETWEDTVFNFNFLKAVSTIYYIHERTYNYHIHENVSTGGGKVFFAPLGFRKVLDSIIAVLEKTSYAKHLPMEYERGAVYSAVRLLMLYYKALHLGKAPAGVDRNHLKKMIKIISSDDAVRKGLLHYKAEAGESIVLPFLLKLNIPSLIDWWCWKKTGKK